MNDPGPRSLFNIDVTFADPRWQEEPAISELFFQSLVHSTFNQLGLHQHSVEVSILLTNDEASQTLNHTYRGHDKPTNVLSFPSLDLNDLTLALSKQTKIPLLLGDIVLSYETIAREADSHHKPFDQHCAHLVVHGLLHLLGYDHEKENEAEIMESLEQTILATLSIPNPY